MSGLVAVRSAHEIGGAYVLVIPPPRAAIAMDREVGRKNRLSTKDLVERISESLFTLFHTLSSTNTDISIYGHYHAIEDIRRDPEAWAKIDQSYNIYEEQANNCRRLWMKLRSIAEKEVPRTTTTGSTSFAPEFRSEERSPSPLEYQSDHWEDTKPERTIGRIDEATDMDVDPPPPNPKRKVRRCHPVPS